MDKAINQQARRQRKAPLDAARPPLPRTGEELASLGGDEPVRMGSGVVKRLLSTGGMAYIYEIWNEDLEVTRAVKVLKPDHTSESEHRFYTEMKITAKLHHPNIVEIYAVGKWNGLPYIEMEEIDGVTLETLIQEEGALPLEVCTSIGIMVGRALNYAHRQSYVIYGKEYRGIIHRDLKPSNIMITRRGAVKLMDFGIAKPTSASIHTTEGLIVGTLQYLSPEQLDGRDIDVRADMYSMGAVLYEMLTGERAFPESNIARLVPLKLENRYRPFADYAIKIPSAMRNLVVKSMHKEKERRVQSALELLRGLDKIHRRTGEHSPEQVMAVFMQAPHGAKTIVSIRKRRIVGPALFAAAAALLILAAGAFVLISRLPRSETAGAARERARLSAGQRDFPAPDESISSQPIAPASKPRVTSARKEPTRSTANSDASDRATSSRTASSRTALPQTRPLRSAPPVIIKKAAPPSPARRAGPESAPAAARDPAEALVDKLKTRHGTDDLLAIFCAEIEEGNAADALKIYPRVPATPENTTRRLVYLLRAALQTGDQARAHELLAKTSVPDGEFLVAKSRYLLDRGNLDGARRMAGRAATSPSRFMAPRAFRRSLLYVKARIAGEAFRRSPDPQRRREAMAAWYDIKSLLRNAPEDPYFAKADAEIRALSKTATH